MSLEEHLAEFRRRDKPIGKLSARNKSNPFFLREIEKYIVEWNRKKRMRHKNAFKSIPQALKKYNITRDTFQKLIDDQCGKCDICLMPLLTLSIDHDHLTGKIRGLLCNRCNSVLGFARDNINILNNAAKYLERSMFPRENKCH